MKYVIKGQWVVVDGTSRIGLVDKVLQRRIGNRQDGVVIVQFGAGGPFVQHFMTDLREASQSEINEKEGLC